MLQGPLTAALDGICDSKTIKEADREPLYEKIVAHADIRFGMCAPAHALLVSPPNQLSTVCSCDRGQLERTPHLSGAHCT